MRSTARSIALLVLLGAAAGAEARSETPEIVVGFRAEAPHALADCAESWSRRGVPLAGATADGSDSLDRLRERLRVRRVRSLFRRPDGRPFREQRTRLARRLARAAARSQRRGRHLEPRRSNPRSPMTASSGSRCARTPVTRRSPTT